jgi:hypothetical protein
MDVNVSEKLAALIFKENPEDGVSKFVWTAGIHMQDWGCRNPRSNSEQSWETLKTDRKLERKSQSLCSLLGYQELWAKHLDFTPYLYS